MLWNVSWTLEFKQTRVYHMTQTALLWKTHVPHRMIVLQNHPITWTQPLTFHIVKTQDNIFSISSLVRNFQTSNGCSIVDDLYSHPIFIGQSKTSNCFCFPCFIFDGSKCIFNQFDIWRFGTITGVPWRNTHMTPVGELLTEMLSPVVKLEVTVREIVNMPWYF